MMKRSRSLDPRLNRKRPRSGIPPFITVYINIGLKKTIRHRRQNLSECPLNQLSECFSWYFLILTLDSDHPVEVLLILLHAVNAHSSKIFYSVGKCIWHFREAATVGTSTDDLVMSEVAYKNIMRHSISMHDAHLACNNEVNKDGRRVTDLIVEIRDDCKQRSHFMPTPRNTKGIFIY